MPSGSDSRAGALGTILRAAVLLHESGQSTAMTLIAVRRLSHGLGQPAEVIPGWSTLTVYDPRAGGADALIAQTRPIAINMRRVAALMRTVDDAARRPVDRTEVERALEEAARLKSSSTAAFVAACGFGAAALSVVFGVTDIRAVALIAVTAAPGGLLRRLLATVTSDVLLPIFDAALIAGATGALAGAVGMQVPGGLVALCPAMVMVPGPQILIGAMDLLAGAVLTPVAYLKGIPFAAVGFAAVVAMVPGTYVFRAVAGAAELATHATDPVLLAVVSDGITATLTVAGMAVGLAVPSRVRDWVLDRRHRA